MLRTLAVLYLLPNLPAIICWQLPHHWCQYVSAVSVLGMTASKNIAQYQILVNIGQHPNTNIVLALFVCHISPKLCTDFDKICLMCDV